MVIHKFGDKLYKGLQDTISDHLDEISMHIISTSEDRFLSVVEEVWQGHKVDTGMIRDILMYMVSASNST